MDMRRKRKKEESQIEIMSALAIAVITMAITKSLEKAVISFIISFSIIGGISLAIRKNRMNQYRNLLLNSGLDIIDKMTGEEFENFLLVHFERLGYKGETTPKSNDYGADIILRKDSSKIVVQAKRWTNKVGIEAVQQIIGAKLYYNADKCIVATNCYFTPNAINLASSSAVELWDRNKLIDIFSISDGRNIAQEVASADVKSRVICPKCGAEMNLKKGKFGDFYGCSRYPKCKYTKNIK